MKEGGEEEVANPSSTENENNKNKNLHLLNEKGASRKGKSCKGCLYYSSSLKSNHRNPLCVGFTRSLPKVTRYYVGESEMEASKEGRSLADFRYGCVGYSVYSDMKNNSGDAQGSEKELPVCVGIEVLVDRKVTNANSAPTHAHNKAFGKILAKGHRRVPVYFGKTRKTSKPKTGVSHHTTPLKGLHDLVDASKKNMSEVDLNFPLFVKYPEVVNEDHLMDNVLPGNNVINVSGFEDSTVDLPRKEQENNFELIASISDTNDVPSTMDADLSGPAVPAEFKTSLDSAPSRPEASSALYPTVELGTCSLEPISFPTNTMINGVSSSTTDVGQSSGSGIEDVSDEREESLTRELGELGFHQVDFNKEILKMNDYDLDKRFDVLCDDLDWDSMQDDLQEMNFLLRMQ